MITTMQMYWLVKLDDIRAALSNLIAPVSLIGFITMAFCTILVCIGLFAGNGAYDFYSGKCDKELESLKKSMRIRGFRGLVFSGLCYFLAMILSLCSGLTPSTKQMAAIIIVPKIANSEKVQMAGNKLYDWLSNGWTNSDPTKPKQTRRKSNDSHDRWNNLRWNRRGDSTDCGESTETSTRANNAYSQHRIWRWKLPEELGRLSKGDSLGKEELE